MEFQPEQHGHLATIIAAAAAANSKPGFLFPSLDPWSIFHFLITVLLCLISLFVVLGNSLVVGAIWHESQLHSVTNYLIASLAVADCLVGLVVMPFSIISEIVLGSWSFGATWCDLWHSFDVLASTASIMNLCAISLDRYLAITDPISYPARLTPKRVALLIVSLWTCSALISFPAILWWRSVGKGPLVLIETPPEWLVGRKVGELEGPVGVGAIEEAAAELQKISSNKNISGYLSLGAPEWPASLASPRRLDSEYQLGDSMELTSSNFQDNNLHLGAAEGLGGETLYKCVFTDDTYYLLFSSFISFYGPLCVMLYAYFRIYKAAVKQTRFLKHGSKQVSLGERMANGTQANSGTAGELNRNGLVLRAHRGGGGGGAGSLNLKSVLNKQNSVTTTPLRNPASASNATSFDSSFEQKQQLALSLQSSFEVSNNSSGGTCQRPKSQGSEQRDKASQVLYYESGKLFQKISKLKDVPSISIDANSVGKLEEEEEEGEGEHVGRCGGGAAGLEADVMQEDDELEAEVFIGERLNRTRNQAEPPEVKVVAGWACDNKPASSSSPEGSPARQQQPPSTLSAKLYSNQHVIEIPSHQSSCTSASIGVEPATGGVVSGATPGRNQSSVFESSTASSTPQHTKSQQQQRKVGRKLSRLAKERKAAKTLGIVVGVFILCWLPYFVVNITVALCGSHCITNLEIFVSIVTWLGWLNSAMNPVIYACWSREFRRAFRRVLCSWVVFCCPYGDLGQRLVRKLRLKESSNYSSNTQTASSQQDAYSLSTGTRLSTFTSSLKGNSSSGRQNATLASSCGDSQTLGGGGETVASNCVVTISSLVPNEEEEEEEPEHRDRWPD